MTLRGLIGALALVLLAGRALAGDAPPEPEGYRTGDLRAATPATLSGATVLDLAALEAAVAGGAVLIDVGPAPVKPADMPADRPWLPTHRSIPGAVWLPGAGLGDDLPADREELLLGEVAGLTGGDKAKAVVVFCKPDCWASWNVGRRLVLAGYSAVGWFPGGVDAWQVDHPTAPVEAPAGW
ncbi:rhodanese-like domain-containing protein [Amaricoccus sp.]|uniref:rhodanese-like domain-containing protein n=1 Tax=Amaricoccus sp. TaxID=1872485 RepID=UPI001B5DC3B1|nr:rhodanese-like domain-containing protein [Amaricoccus sp.]MBP7000806.1 PQQ-dependent catabolism-associated CXXCW motif protein [Amaricoccus sp.]